MSLMKAALVAGLAGAITGGIPNAVIAAGGGGTARSGAFFHENTQQQAARLQLATNSGRAPTADPAIARCFYQTPGGYKFSITATGACPSQVQIDPGTNQVVR